MAADLGTVACAEVKACPTFYLKGVGGIGIGRAGIGHAAVKSQTLNLRHFPFHADIGLRFGHADGAFALGGRVAGGFLLGVKEGYAAQDFHALDRFAVHADFRTAVAVFAA